MSVISSALAPATATVPVGKNLRYSSEISSMIFVLGGAGGEMGREVDEELVQYIEESVRVQLSEIVSCNIFFVILFKCSTTLTVS